MEFDITDFFEGKCTDYRKRTVEDYLNMTDQELEDSHDLVQWSFPLHEGSKHAAYFPVIDKADTDKFKQSELATSNLKKMLDRFVKFWGLPPNLDEAKIQKWVRGHNLLRVTRTIRSVRLMGLEEEAREFHKNVREAGVKFGVNSGTLNFWDRAMNEDVFASLR